MHTTLDRYGRYSANKDNDIFTLFFFQIPITIEMYCSRKNNTVSLLFYLAFNPIFHLCSRQKEKHGASDALTEAMKGSPKDRREFFLTGW